MSGGSLDYFYCQLREHVGDFGDRELDELVDDLADLFHDREWYLSADYGKGEWNEARDKFKQKWFTDVGRQERVERAFEETRTELLQSFGLETRYCKDCEHWTVEDTMDADYGDCEFHTGCLMHRCESCERWKKRNDKHL